MEKHIKSDRIAEVSIDKGVFIPLDYLIPDHLNLLPGQRVRVPLRNRMVYGTVLDIKDKKSNKKLLPIEEIIIDEPLLNVDLQDLAKWMSHYYCTPLSRVISSILPTTKPQSPKKNILIKIRAPISKIRTIAETIRTKAPKQSMILDQFLRSKGKPIALQTLLKLSSHSSVKSLEKLEIIQRIAPSEKHFDYLKRLPKRLTPEQSSTLEAINDSIDKDTFSTHLIHGVTGSGKSEIYLQAVERAISLGKGVIILIPEISLLPQMVEEIRGRFANDIAIFHYQIHNASKIALWQKIAKGEITILTGARSAIFAPIKNLGLIIVDEEDDLSYKNMDNSPCYNARDIAIYRGYMNNATIILGSATPSIESYTHGLNKKYKIHRFTKKIHDTALKIDLVDMSKEPENNRILSRALIKAISENLKRGEQTIILLNRRGYYTSRICKDCAYIEECKNCDSILTYHKGENLLSCHLCNFTLRNLSCTECGGRSIIYNGWGTERLQELLKGIFPSSEVFRIDLDSRKKGDILGEFKKGKGDILVGTQMLAKGLHIPNLSLVGVVGIDSALQRLNYRSTEETFSLIMQVSGRSGREIPGKVILQAFDTKHKILEFVKNGDYTSFYKWEIENRKKHEYPPYTNLSKIIFSGKNDKKTEASAKQFRSQLLSMLSKKSKVYPVTPSGKRKIQGRYRYQFIVKSETHTELARCLATLPRPKELMIDVNTLSTW